MPDKPSIAKIRASVNGGQMSPESLRLELDVNSFPVVTAGVADTTGDVNVMSPASADVFARIGKLQQQRLAGRSDPDVVVEADDGLGGSVMFSGFLSAPILNLSRSSVGDKFSAVGKAALLDALDLSIYRAGYVTERAETGSGDGESFTPIPAAKDGDVPKVLRAVTDALVSNFDRTLASEPRAVSQRMLEIQHGINTSGPLDLWRSMLDDSSVVFKSWDAAFKKCPVIARQLSENVRHALESRLPGFWNTLRSLMSSFQMFYIPEFNGPGRFERADKKLAEPEATLDISASGISLSDGSPRLLPPGGVVMTAAASLAERAETQANPGLPRIMAYAPEQLLPGFIQQETVPFWLVRGNGIPILGSEIDTKPVSDSVDLDLAKRRKRKRQGSAYRDEVDTVSEGMMTELCEVMFKTLQLEHATVDITTALDFQADANIGKRVTANVKSALGGDGGSFTAFLSGVTHTIDLRLGKELNSSTQLRFTHAKFA